MDVHREAVRRRHAILAPKHARIAENQIAAVQRNSRRAVREQAARDHAELSLRFLARVDSDRRAVRDFAVVEREGAQQAKADFGAQNGEMDGHEMMESALEIEAELAALDGRVGDEELAERVHGRGNVEMNAGVLDLMESAGFDGNGGIAANSITGRSEEAVLKTNLVKKGECIPAFAVCEIQNCLGYFCSFKRAMTERDGGRSYVEYGRKVTRPVQ